MLNLLEVYWHEYENLIVYEQINPYFCYKIVIWYVYLW